MPEKSAPSRPKPFDLGAASRRPVAAKRAVPNCRQRPAAPWPQGHDAGNKPMPWPSAWRRGTDAVGVDAGMWGGAVGVDVQGCCDGGGCGPVVGCKALWAGCGGGLWRMVGGLAEGALSLGDAVAEGDGQA